MKLEELKIGGWYFIDATALRVCLRKLKYVGKKYAIVELKNGEEEWVTLSMLLEFGGRAKDSEI